MHFTLTVALPQGESVGDYLDPYCEMLYEWNEDGSVVRPDGKRYKDSDEVPFTFYDRLSLGGRRDGYIKGKRGAHPEFEFEEPKGYPEINWKNRGSAFIKSAIKGFGFDDKKLSKHPETFAYFIDDVFYERPEHYLYHDDEAGYQKACKEFDKKVKTWYKSVPDDYVIYIIDYHV